jgi:hypothetical protein
MQKVAALFVRSDSIYKSLPGVDCYDKERNSYSWRGGVPCIVHPPCRGWGRMRQFSEADGIERSTGIASINWVRIYGGVLEHPAESTLFTHQGLPRPGRAPDKFGGWTMEIDQFRFGHRAEKLTWLYIVGCHPDNLPTIPELTGSPKHCIRPTKSYPRLPSVTKPEREKTPRAFAEWLVEVSRRCYR